MLQLPWPQRFVFHKDLSSTKISDPKNFWPQRFVFHKDLSSAKISSSLCFIILWVSLRIAIKLRVHTIILYIKWLIIYYYQRCKTLFKVTKQVTTYRCISYRTEHPFKLSSVLSSLIQLKSEEEEEMHCNWTCDSKHASEWISSQVNISCRIGCDNITLHQLKETSLSWWVENWVVRVLLRHLELSCLG